MPMIVENSRILSAPEMFRVEPLSPIPPFDHAERTSLLAAIAPLNKPLDDLCREILSRHPEVEIALDLFSAHPLRPGNGIDLKTGRPIADPRDNIGRHCAKVASGVTAALSPLCHAKKLSEEQLRAAEKAGLGHDCLKGLEIDRRNAAIQKGADIAGAYSEEAYKTEDRVLKERNISPELLRSFISFGQNTGHRSIARFLRVEDGRLAGVQCGDLTGLAAHVVDSLTYSTKPANRSALNETEFNVFVPAAERMILSMFHHVGDELLPKPQGYPFLWTEGLAADPEGKIVEVKDIHNPPEGHTVLGSYAFLQIYSAKEGAGVLNSLIGLTDSGEPDLVLCNFLNHAASVQRSSTDGPGTLPASNLPELNAATITRNER